MDAESGADSEGKPDKLTTLWMEKPEYFSRFHLNPFPHEEKKTKNARAGFFRLLTDSGDLPRRYPRHGFKFQNLGTFHPSHGAALLSLRRFPACEWRGKERNATPAEGGGREEVQYHTTLIEGAPGPNHGVTAGRVGAKHYA